MLYKSIVMGMLQPPNEVELILHLDLSPVIGRLLLAFAFLEIGVGMALIAAWPQAGAGVGVGGVLIFAVSRCRRPDRLAAPSSCVRLLAAPLPSLLCAGALFVSPPVESSSAVPFDGILGVISGLLAAAVLLYESNTRGFLVATILDMVLCLVCVYAAVMEVVATSSGPSVAGRTAALALLAVLCVVRMFTSRALHPYTQPLQPPKHPEHDEVSIHADGDERSAGSPRPHHSTTTLSRAPTRTPPPTTSHLEPEPIEPLLPMLDLQRGRVRSPKATTHSSQTYSTRSPGSPQRVRGGVPHGVRDARRLPDTCDRRPLSVGA